MLRSFFIGLSTNKPFRTFSESSSIGRRVSRRFVAGMSVADAIAATLKLNAEGIDVSMDSLGESVFDVAQAEHSAAIYHQLLDAIAARNLRANVSVKLSQMGIEIPSTGLALAERIVGDIVAHAASIGTFVRIDMEGSAWTEITIALTERLHQLHPGAVGTVLQAYLHRTEADVHRLLAQGIRIRLCKGAYKEPPTIAFPAKADVDANYIKLMKVLVTSPVFCGIATHDELIVSELCNFVQQHQAQQQENQGQGTQGQQNQEQGSQEQGIDKRAFEFQLLYGIRRDLQRQLIAQGFGVRVYLPFGSEWYPYFMRRLAERPANVLFLAKNFFKS